MKELIEYIARSLASDPDAVVVTETVEEGRIVLRLEVAAEDKGKVIGRQGRVVTYEINESFVPKAMANIKKFNADPSNLTVTIADIYQGITERGVDRVVLDVPEPWQAVSTIGDALVMGGILLSFLPTILQVHQLIMELERDTRFQLVEMVETLLRPWHVTQRSVRPAHRMVAHSGFLTTAVRCQPRAGAVRPAPSSDEGPDSGLDEVGDPSEQETDGRV